jgi:hypothetical protein
MPIDRPHRPNPPTLSDAKAQYQPVGIEDYDRAVRDWFDLTVDSKVSSPTNGGQMKVPVVVSTGERWAVSREKKAIRDQNGVLILPIAAVRRVSIDPDTSMKALGVQTPNIQIAKKISQKTGLLHQDSLARQVANRLKSEQAVYEVTTVPFPDRGMINYELKVQTSYQLQMNQFIQKMLRELDLQKSFVAPFNNEGRHSLNGVQFEDRGNRKNRLDGPYAVGYFESALDDQGNFDEFTDQERIIMYTVTFRVPYVFFLDPEGEKPAVQVERTAYAVAFQPESTRFIEDENEWEKIFGVKR